MAEPRLRGATGVDRLFSFPGSRIRCVALPPARPRCCSFRNDSNSAANSPGVGHIFGASPYQALYGDSPRKTKSAICYLPFVIPRSGSASPYQKRAYLPTSLSTFDQFVQKAEQVAKVRGQPSLDLGTRPSFSSSYSSSSSSSRAYLGPRIWLYPTRSPEI
jgi:hypothetical protein